MGHIPQLVRQNGHPALVMPLASQIRTEEKGYHRAFSVFFGCPSLQWSPAQELSLLWLISGTHLCAVLTQHKDEPGS